MEKGATKKEFGKEEETKGIIKVRGCRNNTSLMLKTAKVNVERNIKCKY